MAEHLVDGMQEGDGEIYVMWCGAAHECTVAKHRAVVKWYKQMVDLVLPYTWADKIAEEWDQRKAAVQYLITATPGSEGSR